MEEIKAYKTKNGKVFENREEALVEAEKIRCSEYFKDLMGANDLDADDAILEFLVENRYRIKDLLDAAIKR